MIVALDTAPMIWGLRQATAGDARGDRMIELTRNYFAWCQRRGYRLALPTPALSEFLIREPAANHQGILAALRHRFFLLPFDSAAARIAAEIQHDRDRTAQIRAAHAANRQRLRVDAMILATAIAHKCPFLATGDADFPRLVALAGGRLVVHRITDDPASAETVGAADRGAERQHERFGDVNESADGGVEDPVPAEPPEE